ncbi:hypothetical protein AGMMS50249_7240 [candidate division SR1 bacterium]|nr:hypothetical protein AGMMS50249_7240 [candidate division SR1 bacterium]
MKIIGITGPQSSGKGTVVDFLKSEGYEHLSVRSFLTDEIIKRGLTIDRDNMRDVANDLRSKFGPSYIIEQLFQKAKESGKPTIIESIRCVGEIETLRKESDFFLLGIDADQKIRYERAINRGSETDHISRQKFQEQENAEMNNSDPTKQNISECMKMADLIITNNGTIAEFREKLLNSL